MFIISDEIHSDLVFKPHIHSPLGLISPILLNNSATCLSVSKTFNLPSLKTSSIIIANPEIRLRYKKILHSNGLLEQDIFGVTATIAAYRYGEKWLEQLQYYLKDNLYYLKDYIKTHLPEIKVIEPEGTYLVWLDFRNLFNNHIELSSFLLNRAKVWMVDGYKFGDGGAGFERINIACPRTILKNGLERVKKAVEEYY